MASPALAGLILEFFYTGPSALASRFPEVFSQKVPKSVVCLAATAMSTSLWIDFVLMLFHSCELVSTSIQSQVSDKTTRSSTTLIPKFLPSWWACRPKLMPISSMLQWLERLEFTGQLLGSKSSSHVHVKFPDSFQCIVCGWWQYDCRWRWFWRHSGLRLCSVLFLLLFFFDTRSCEMLCIVLRVCVVWFVRVNECDRIHSTVKHLATHY